LITTVSLKSGHAIKAYSVQPVRLRKSHNLGKTTVFRDFDTALKQPLRNALPSIVLNHRHSDDSCSSRFKEKADSSYNFAVVLGYQESMTYCYERPLYVIEVGVQ